MRRPFSLSPTTSRSRLVFFEVEQQLAERRVVDLVDRLEEGREVAGCLGSDRFIKLVLGSRCSEACRPGPVWLMRTISVHGVFDRGVGSVVHEGRGARAGFAGSGVRKAPAMRCREIVPALSPSPRWRGGRRVHPVPVAEIGQGRCPPRLGLESNARRWSRSAPAPGISRLLEGLRLRCRES